MGLSAMSLKCPPSVSVTAFATDSEGGWVGFEIESGVDILETRVRLTWGLGGQFTRTAMNVPRCIMYCRLAVVFAWGERTAAPRSLTLLLHAALNLHGPGLTFPYLARL